MRPRVLKRITTLAVLLSLCSALAIHSQRAVKSAPAAAVTSTKISPDLRKVMQTDGGATVRVIVQSTSTNSSGLIGGLPVGGIVVGLLSTLNIRIADIQANSAEVLAADPSVAYISLDADVQTMGHIVTTTGAARWARVLSE